MSGGFGAGAYCGGVDCEDGHRLSAAWHQRTRSGGRCADKTADLATEERPLSFTARDADERARDAYRDEHEGTALDW